MRKALAAVPVLTLLVLAGCATPAEEREDDPLVGLCPQWEQGPGNQVTGLVVRPGTPQERELAASQDDWQNHTLDVYRVRIQRLNATAPLELRAFSAAPESKQLGLRDYRGDEPRIVPVLRLDGADVGQEFDVHLSSVAHGAPSAHVPARLQWTLDAAEGEADLDYEVTFLYKVCGADV